MTDPGAEAPTEDKNKVRACCYDNHTFQADKELTGFLH